MDRSAHSTTITIGPFQSRLQTDEFDVYQTVRALLSYTDRNIAYRNYQQGYILKDPTCYLLNQHGYFYSGLVEVVTEHLKQEGITVTLINQVAALTPTAIALPEWLRPHQIEIIETMKAHPRGIIESPPGSGKTIAAAYFLAHFPQQGLLFTVPEIALMHKTADVFSGIFNEPIGLVGGGKRQFERITVGVINSLSKIDNSVLATYDIILHDEAHHAANSYYEKVMKNCHNAKIVYGLTGTAFRDGGDTLKMIGLCGPKRLTITASQITKTSALQDGTILQPEYYFINDVPMPTFIYRHAIARRTASGQIIYNYDTPTGKPDLGEVYQKALVENDERNARLIDILETLLAWPQRTGGILLLVERIDHGQRLCDLAEQRGLTLPFLSGSSSAAVRRDYIDRLKTGDCPCVCSTSIFNEGQDIPNLSAVIIASGGSNKRRIIQQVGRVTRTAPGKTRAIVVDIWDKERYYLQQHAIRRKQAIEQRHGHCIRQLSYPQFAQRFISIGS